MSINQNSATFILPQLPSSRAKEFAKKAAPVAQREIENDDAEKAIIPPTPIVSQPRPSFSLQASDPMRDSSSVQSQYERERSEKLALLRQQEQKALGQFSPLEPSVTCESIHQYLSTTSHFLNSFISDSNNAIEGTSLKLSVLEKQMALLESKLASIPGLVTDE